MKSLNKTLLAALAAVSLSGVAFAQNAPVAPTGAPQDQGMHRGHHGRHGGPGMQHGDPAKRIEHMVARAVPDATADQKVRLQAIAKAAMADLKPLHDQQRTLRAERMKLLAAQSIDRAALERLRQQQSQLNETRSKRMEQAWADAAEMLTPAQRAKVAERMAKRGHRGEGRRGEGRGEGQPKRPA